MSLRSRGVHYDKPKSCSLESLAISRGIIESPTSKHPLVERLRQELAARGTDGYGFSDFQKRLNILDRDNSRTVNLEQVKIAFQHCSLNFSDQEISILFHFFENCGKIYIDMDEFILGIRGPTSYKRRELIERAFRQIDTAGDGILPPEDIIDRFDPTQHPDVKSGTKKAQDIFREFLRSFEVGGEVDGKITRHEFINYYSNVSAAIEHDDYFESMLRNAWHITSGCGGFEQSRRLHMSDGLDVRANNGATEALDFSPTRHVDGSSSFQRGGYLGNGNAYQHDDRNERFGYGEREAGNVSRLGNNGSQTYDRDRRPGSSGNNRQAHERHQKF